MVSEKVCRGLLLAPEITSLIVHSVLVIAFALAMYRLTKIQHWLKHTLAEGST